MIGRETPDAGLLFAGDLVNRGPASLEALRQVKSLGDRAVSVLGNHDLHLLAVACGIRPMKAGDSIQPILDAPDRDALIDWVRHRPMAHAIGDGMLMVHAGVLPQWDMEKTLSLAHEVEMVLRGPDWKDFLFMLEERCFPRTRDKMKSILRAMDLPFYDPWLIVQKTQGRMADDHQWIRIEEDNRDHTE